MDSFFFLCRICVTVVTFRPEHQKHVVFSTLAFSRESAQTAGRIYFAGVAPLFFLQNL